MEEKSSLLRALLGPLTVNYISSFPGCWPHTKGCRGGVFSRPVRAQHWQSSETAQTYTYPGNWQAMRSQHRPGCDAVSSQKEGGLVRPGRVGPPRTAQEAGPEGLEALDMRPGLSTCMEVTPGSHTKAGAVAKRQVPGAEGAAGAT